MKFRNCWSNPGNQSRLKPKYNILGLLRWFGLLEYRGPPEIFEVGWRKTPLFDRFLSFDVRLERERRTGH